MLKFCIEMQEVLFFGIWIHFVKIQEKQNSICIFYGEFVNQNM